MRRFKFATMRTTVLILATVAVSCISSCTQKVRKDSAAEPVATTNTDNNTQNTPAKEEKLNSIGIPTRLPYAADLEAYYLVNCKLNKAGNGVPDQALWEERGKVVTRLEAYEKKYKGKELEEYQKWGSVAANAINNCP